MIITLLMHSFKVCRIQALKRFPKQTLNSTVSRPQIYHKIDAQLSVFKVYHMFVQHFVAQLVLRASTGRKKIYLIIVEYFFFLTKIRFGVF